MSKYDLGAIVAAVLGGIGPVLVWFREALGRAFGRLWASIAALIASPAVWAAVALTALAGFWIGHIEGSSGKRALRAHGEILSTRLEKATAALDEANGRATSVAQEARAWKGRAEAAHAELSRLTGQPVPEGGAVAASPKRQVAKARASKPVVREGTRAAWWPFSN